MAERLESWKDIAAYLGREVRTAQRWALERSLPVHRLPGGTRPRVYSVKSEIDAWMRDAEARPREDAVSVAVLPFLNLAGSVEDQYFGDGLADDVINALVRLPGLRVTARTSSFAFSARGQDVREIGARLKADWLIEGSIRRDHDRVRVSAQLVSTRDGYHAWSERFDRRLDDIFGIQDDIASAIALALKVKLGLRGSAARPTEDLVAYELWVKGRSISQLFTPASFAEALACYEEAIARDPAFAKPYFGLADLLYCGVQFGLTTNANVLPRAREAITTSLELDDSFGEAHALLGVFRGILDYDWPGAEAAFQRAFELSPGSATVLMQHAWYHLVPRRRIPQALAEAQQAIVLDPLAPFAHGFLCLVLTAARQYGRAAQAGRRAVELGPDFTILHWFYGTALLKQGRLVKGFQYSRNLYEKTHQPLVAGALVMLYGLFLRRKKARELFAELEEMARTKYATPVAFALAYLGLGDDARAFEWFNKAIDARDPIVTHLPSMPFYDGIRGDPRFAALVKRMHLD